MPGGISEAGLVAEATAAGQERGSRGPVEGAFEGMRSGVVSAGRCDAKDNGRAVDSGGGAGDKDDGSLSLENGAR